MTSGNRRSSRRRAGQRPDELLPGEDSEAVQVGDDATGSPGGEVGAGGLAGLPVGDAARATLNSPTSKIHRNRNPGEAGGRRRNSGEQADERKLICPNANSAWLDLRG